MSALLYMITICHIHKLFSSVYALSLQYINHPYYVLFHIIILFSQDYFGECSETVIKDNVVTVYELLEEMLDNGFPLATESNILKEMIRPPTILRTMVNTLTGPQNVTTAHTSSSVLRNYISILFDVLAIVDSA